MFRLWAAAPAPGQTRQQRGAEGVSGATALTPDVRRSGNFLSSAAYNRTGELVGRCEHSEGAQQSAADQESVLQVSFAIRAQRLVR